MGNMEKMLIEKYRRPVRSAERGKAYASPPHGQKFGFLSGLRRRSARLREWVVQAAVANRLEETIS